MDNTRGYESPIKLVHAELEKAAADFAKKLDEGVMTEITKKIGVIADKEELLKALAYDRDQYTKGYHDGKMDAVVHAHWEMDDWCESYCSNCGQYALLDEDKIECRSEYCPRCGALMDNGGDADG